jgi:hypothetical protein
MQARIQGKVQLKNSIWFKGVQSGSYEFGPYTQYNLWNNHTLFHINGPKVQACIIYTWAKGKHLHTALFENIKHIEVLKRANQSGKL